MNAPIVCRVAVPTPLFRLFDYLPPAHDPAPPPGSRVRIPLGKRSLIGLVVEHGRQADIAHDALKPIDAVLDDALLDAPLLELLRWTLRYYAAPPGELITLGLPAALRRDRPIPDPAPEWLRRTDSADELASGRAPRRRQVLEMLSGGPRPRAELIEAGIRPAVIRQMLDKGLIATCEPPPTPPVAGPELNPDQRRAVAAILRRRHDFGVVLLAGVTGSGKTEVYLHAARHLIARGRQVLVLVPEIGLTPQFVRRVETRLGWRAYVYHSGLADGERLAAWQAARNGRARLIVGTRSAVFLPLHMPGLIVIDEEHDSSFKQFEGARYHARDVAVMRARQLNIPIVLGSATPSLESLGNARADRYRMLELPQRAGSAPQPHWTIEDLRGQTLRDGLGDRLIERIRATLEQSRQVLIYRNRRGYAPVLICNECGWQADCPDCSAHMTLHLRPERLSCHHCGRRRPRPSRCPDCGAPDMQALGAGTERLEDALARRFPDTEVVRIDRDAVRGKDTLNNLLNRLRDEEPRILVGTQMLAKGHHLPGIGLAVMLDADQMLYSADFRAPERLAQSVVQVAGRSGRTRAGRFILQTRHPEHPLIQRLAGGDYLAVANELLDERNAAALPPARPLVMIRAEAREGATSQAFLRQVARLIDAREVEINGPLEAILQRRAGYWRHQLWLTAPTRAHLQTALADLPPRIEALPDARKVRWHVDVDPIEL